MRKKAEIAERDARITNLEAQLTGVQGYVELFRAAEAEVDVNSIAATAEEILAAGVRLAKAKRHQDAIAEIWARLSPQEQLALVQQQMGDEILANFYATRRNEVLTRQLGTVDRLRLQAIEHGSIDTSEIPDKQQITFLLHHTSDTNTYDFIKNKLFRTLTMRKTGSYGHAVIGEVVSDSRDKLFVGQQLYIGRQQIGDFDELVIADDGTVVYRGCQLQALDMNDETFPDDLLDRYTLIGVGLRGADLLSERSLEEVRAEYSGMSEAAQAIARQYGLDDKA